MMTTPRAGYGRGVVALLLACTFWGTTGVAASYIPGINPVLIGASTMGVGGLILGLTSLPGLWLVWHNIGAKRLVFIGAAGLVVYSSIFYVGMAWAGVALGNVIALGSAPIFAGLLEWAIDGRPPSKQWAIATVVTVLGGALLITGRSFGEDGGGVDRDSTLIVWGIALALFAGFSYALYTYMANKLMAPHKDRPAGLAPRQVISAIQFASAVPLNVLLVVLIGINPGQFSGVSLALPVMAYLAIFPTAVGHTLLGYGLRSMPASRAAVYTLFEPIVAVLLAVLIVGEIVTFQGWMGFVIVLIGLALLSWKPRSAVSNK